MGWLINYCPDAPRDFAPGGDADGNSVQIAAQNQLITAGRFKTFCNSLGVG